MKKKNGHVMGIGLLLAAGLLFSLGACAKPAADASAGASGTAPGVKQVEQQECNPLTGETGYRKGAVGKRPVAIMINNAPAARPQWGLCSADIVMEGLAEGGVTRMMWLYADGESIPEKVGSVRSARHDFVEMAEGLDAVFVHWGGSPKAYEVLRARSVDHIDGMQGTYFLRDKTRSTAIEHRGYTGGTLISQAIEKKSVRTQLNEEYAVPFRFAQSKRIVSGEDCKAIKVSFSQDYNHTFRYNEEDNLYYNYMNANKMVQDGGKQMAVSNVLILYTPVTVTDSKGHIDMDLSGGEGFYVSGGKMEHITWEKGEATSPLKLYNANGKTLELNTGKSWIGWVPSERQSKTIVENGV